MEAMQHPLEYPLTLLLTRNLPISVGYTAVGPNHRLEAIFYSALPRLHY